MEYPDIFLGFLIFLILGLFAGLITDLPILSAAVFLCSLFLFIFKKSAILFLFLAVFLTGAARSNQAADFPPPNAKNEEIILTGDIDQEPEEKALHQIIVVRVEKIFDRGWRGKMLVYADKAQKFIPKEKISLRGKLISPQNFGDFDYKDYLAKMGISSIIYYPKITKEREAPIFWRFVFEAKQKLRLVIDETLIFPKNILLRAIVLGDKKEMPDYLQESFNKSGIRHITAISGMHIAILMNVLMAIFIGLGIKRKISGLAVMLFVLFYLFLIGFPASAIRASIMGAGIILAQIFSRMPDPIRFLLFAAAAIILINPFLFFDAGFQLSFLAALGINYLSPFFNKKLKKIPKNFGIRSVLSMTFSAQIFTLPVLFHHFGYLSLLSPVANVLIVPIMPLVLAMGILGIIAGLIFLPLGFLVFIPLSFILGYVIFISDLIAAIPFLTINARVSLAVVLIYYLLLVLFARHQKRKERFWFLEY